MASKQTKEGIRILVTGIASQVDDISELINLLSEKSERLVKCIHIFNMLLEEIDELRCQFTLRAVELKTLLNDKNTTLNQSATDN